MRTCERTEVSDPTGRCCINLIHGEESSPHGYSLVAPELLRATMAAAVPPPSEANPVSLKVMRLAKPSFHFALPVPSVSAKPPAEGTTLDEDAQPGVALSGMLALPQSFGDIYLGETFSCYISLCNISRMELSQVGLKVEVQTQLQRETLADSSVSGEAVKQFASQQTLDKIIEYDLKDVGIHILICSALYTDRAGERKYFRKFFKFQVWAGPMRSLNAHAFPGVSLALTLALALASGKQPALNEVQDSRALAAQRGPRRDAATERDAAPALPAVC